MPLVSPFADMGDGDIYRSSIGNVQKTMDLLSLRISAIK